MTKNNDTGNENGEDHDGPDTTAEPDTEQSSADPVRKWTLIVLGICVLLMAWYLVADRITPFTSQARVYALVVPVAPEVSGTVTDVHVSNNQSVAAGEPLFNIERDRYQLAVETAQANLQSARQATGVSTANIDAAESAVDAARATLDRAARDAERLRRIRAEDAGAISVRRLEQAEALLTVSAAQVGTAEANLEKAREDLGARGDENVRILEAQAALEQANINLRRTSVIAPEGGVVTDVRVNRGNFAAAGAPQMTFISTRTIWVQADYTENNLGNIKPGDDVEIVFDSLPGRVLPGKVRSSGFGVSVGTTPLGSLPTVENNRQWLRDAQRFPVVIDFTVADTREQNAVRVGAQASVIVYTGNNWLFNAIAAINIRIASLLTYAF